MAGFDVSALSDFTQEQRAELRSITLNAAQTIPYINLYEGVKYSEKLPTLESRGEWQDGDGCVAINPSGTTAFAQVTVTVETVRAEDGFCLADLKNKFTQKYLRPGSTLEGNESGELMRATVERWMKNIAIDDENAIWQSATTNTFDSRFKQFNGFIYTIDNTAGVISNQTEAGTAFTTSTMAANIITIFDNQWAATPSAVQRNLDAVTVCGDDVFNTLVVALRNQDLFHFDPNTGNQAAKTKMLTMPATGMKVVALPGLNKKNHSALPPAYKERIFTFYKENLVLGTDMKNDLEDLEVWYEKKDDKVYVRLRWKRGCAIYFPTHVVQYKNV